MKMPRPSSRIRAFFFSTFAWSWTCWLLSPAVKTRSPSLATVPMFAGSFGPSPAAVLVLVALGLLVQPNVAVSRQMRAR